MHEDLQKAALAIVVASVLAPLLGRFLSKIFPPTPESDGEVVRNPKRCRVVEYSGVVFLLIGVAIPFLMQSTDKLSPTADNIAMIFSFGALFMVGGMAGLASLLGDIGAGDFLTYLEKERRISRTGARTIARLLSAASVVALLILLVRA